MISEQLSNASVWEGFLTYKQMKHHLTAFEEADLKTFIRDKEYLSAVSSILTGSFCAVPEKKMIRKLQNSGKRTVYLFPREINYVLKLLTYLLIRKYDSIFPDNLYSFRVNFGVSRAISNLLGNRHLHKKYSYKADISNYFNSIPVNAVLEQLNGLLAEDRVLSDFFTKLLSEPFVNDCGILKEEKKGVMAGTPTAVFLANLYLKDLDEQFLAMNVPYARYSDDIIFFADSIEEIEGYIAIFKTFMVQKGLKVNKDKEILTQPQEAWSFLGISYKDRQIDVSPIALQKMKDKIRRKARAIKRWQIRKKASDMQAVRAFIRSMNYKFFDAKSEHEMTWTRWYFPLLTTSQSLKEIDLYMQQWVRFLTTGRHTMKNYNLRYCDIKENGYRSLVHEYYEYRQSDSQDRSDEACK